MKHFDDPLTILSIRIPTCLLEPDPDDFDSLRPFVTSVFMRLHATSGQHSTGDAKTWQNETLESMIARVDKARESFHLSIRRMRTAIYVRERLKR